MDGSEQRRLHPTRRQVMETAAALAILGYTGPSFSAEANPAVPPLPPSGVLGHVLLGAVALMLAR